MVQLFNQEEINEFLVQSIHNVLPKSRAQIQGEIDVTRKFLENFCGDNPRFIARGFSVAGDFEGQISDGYRFPYGQVCIITPFNFPIEIPVL